MADQNEYTVTPSWTAVKDGAGADITGVTLTIYNEKRERVYFHKALAAPAADYFGGLWIENETDSADRAAKVTLGGEKLYVKSNTNVDIIVFPA